MWNLSYPIDDDALDQSALSVRGRTTSGAGQFELAGAGIAADGSQVRARDIVDHSIGFEVLIRGTNRTICIDECYPVREVGGKVRINVQDSSGVRPNIGNLFAVLFLLPDVSQVGKASELEDNGFSDKAYWIDAISVTVADSKSDTFILRPTRFVFATANKDNPDQFSGAMAFDFDERLAAILTICRKGMDIAAGGVPAALKYYSDVFEGRARFEHNVASAMRKIVVDYLESSQDVQYQAGDDPLAALQKLVDARPEEQIISHVEPVFSASVPEPHNLIFFGAPGTGKSYRLARQAEKYFDKRNVRRVTFHPDYTYAQFVGCYKPVTTIRTVTDEDGTESTQSEISYGFVPGPFLETYIAAVQNPGTNYLLVVEEINRANPAAAFGDVFQLLDRDSDGRSEYAIAVPREMREYLRVFLPEYATTAHIQDPERLLSEQLRLRDEVERLSLPPNMFIWATMNSADQGVFPMDTAFKRRWDFRYMDINKGSGEIAGYAVPVGTPVRMVSWDALRRGINQVLLEAGVNEDKLLGPFFISPARLADPDSFTQVFKDKVLLYLFEDAAKTKASKVFSHEGRATYSDVCKDFEDLGELAFRGMRELPPFSPVNASVTDELEAGEEADAVEEPVSDGAE